MTSLNLASASQVEYVLAPYSVRGVRSLGGGLFLVELDQDPGPETIGRKGLESDRVEDVQPNFVYRAAPPQDRALERKRGERGDP